MNKSQQLIEARHLMRKHVLIATVKGRAMTVRCTECGKNGADTPDGIKHEKDCRYANLIERMGATVQYLSAEKDGRSMAPPASTTATATSMSAPPAMAMAMSDDCLS